ncbi:MAG: hypothetical protein LH619_00500 [Chitinophagaceae bacterium]|nr:hypothetical protein [Chitinophagaceae bacterium]
MKSILAPLLVSSLIFIACNNEKPKDSITDSSKDGKEQVIVDPNKVEDVIQDMQQLKEDLTKLTPLTTDELKAKLPEQLMDAAVSDVDVNAAMGATVANANYKINDSTSLKLEIVDCAGPGGAGVFSLQYLNMINVNSDDEVEYVKTIDFNGGRAMENCRKNRNRCTLAFFSGNRFLVTLRGDNVGIDALKDVAMKLNLK